MLHSSGIRASTLFNPLTLYYTLGIVLETDRTYTSDRSSVNHGMLTFGH